jgi:hypothetical protein
MRRPAKDSGGFALIGRLPSPSGEAALDRLPSGDNPSRETLMNKPYLFACLLLLAVAFDAGAEDPVLRSGDILAQQREIRADMDARTDRYVDMPRSTRKAILADQDRLAVLLEGKADTSQLDPSSMDEVVSLLASINAAVNRTGDERLICTREARIGSNYMTRVCRTPSQLREQQAAGQKLLNDETSGINCSDNNGCI